MHAISLVQVALLALASSSWAISVTEPATGDIWSSGGPNTVVWNEVSTDPTQFSMTLVQGGNFKQMLASNVDGTKGTLTITASLPTGTGYQVNIVNSMNTGAILAQSGLFNITQGGASSSASSTGTGSSTTGSSTTGSSTTGSSSATDSASATTAAASDTNIPNSSGTALNPTATKSGAASLSIPSHIALMGLLAAFGLALV